MRGVRRVGSRGEVEGGRMGGGGTYGVVFGAGGEDVAAEGVVAGCGGGEEGVEAVEVGHFGLRRYANFCGEGW